MKHSPLFMRAPTTSMPGSRPLSRISRAVAPLASSAWVIARAVASLPSMMAFLTCS